MAMEEGNTSSTTPSSKSKSQKKEEKKNSKNKKPSASPEDKTISHSTPKTSLKKQGRLSRVFSTLRGKLSKNKKKSGSEVISVEEEPTLHTVSQKSEEKETFLPLENLPRDILNSVLQFWFLKKDKTNPDNPFPLLLPVFNAIKPFVIKGEEQEVINTWYEKNDPISQESLKAAANTLSILSRVSKAFQKSFKNDLTTLKKLFNLTKAQDYQSSFFIQNNVLKNNHFENQYIIFFQEIYIIGIKNSSGILPRQLLNLRSIYSNFEAKQITKLSISNSSAYNTTFLPKKILEFTNLEEIILSAPNISIPPYLASFPRLQTLKLNSMKIEVLPNILSELISLTHLDISHNQIQSVGNTLDKLTNLKVLNAHTNKLSEFLNVNSLVNLESANFSSNQLEGISVISFSLQSLNLSKNKLSNFRNITGTALINLNLSHNQITAILENIGALVNLQALNLEENQISSVSNELDRLQSLTEINLSNNKLDSCPQSLERLKNIQTVNLGHNPFHKSKKICAYRNIDVIILDNIGLTDIPFELLQNPPQTLNLSRNNIDMFKLTPLKINLILESKVLKKIHLEGNTNFEHFKNHQTNDDPIINSFHKWLFEKK